MWPFKENSFPPPPVPEQLREMLKDYPELIQVLQDDLNSVITNPMGSTPPFEVAIWRLEDALSGFISQARHELTIANAEGDLAAIEQAEKKVDLMLSARSSGDGMRDLSELLSYFDAYEGIK